MKFSNFALLMALIILPTLSWASGSANGGGGYEHLNGGDMCEYRFNAVRDDLKKWIMNGGSNDLQLPFYVSHETYRQLMLQKIDNAQVSCSEEKLFIGDIEKTCKNFVDSNGVLNIKCHRDSFQNTSESDQYILVHHEYAGLAGFEKNNGAVSSYEISNQITGYLENRIVKKLAVKPSLKPSLDPFDPASCPEVTMTLQESFNLVPADGGTFGKFTIRTRSRECDLMNNCGDWVIIPNQALLFSQTYEGYPNVSIVLLPAGGTVELTSMVKQKRMFIFRNEFDQNSNSGILGQCGALELFTGKCILIDLPDGRFLGEASGVIGAHCARVTLNQKRLKYKLWREIEVVFFARY